MALILSPICVDAKHESVIEYWTWVGLLFQLWFCLFKTLGHSPYNIQP